MAAPSGRAPRARRPRPDQTAPAFQHLTAGERAQVARGRLKELATIRYQQELQLAEVGGLDLEPETREQVEAEFRLAITQLDARIGVVEQTLGREVAATAQEQEAAAS